MLNRQRLSIAQRIRALREDLQATSDSRENLHSDQLPQRVLERARFAPWDWLTEQPELFNEKIHRA